jgi:hypothetical protein
MSRDITPSQNVYTNAYRNIIFPSRVNDYQVFASNVFSNLLKAFGNDIVLDNFDISNVSHTSRNVNVTVSDGWAIVDSILCHASESSDLEYEDANSLSDDGKFVAYLSYRYLQQLLNNPLRVRIAHVSSDGSVITPGWESNRDRIVVGIFDFELDADDNIISFEISDDVSIVIDGTTYYVGGSNNSNITKLFSNVKEFLVNPDMLRDGDVAVTYNYDEFITSINYNTPLGDFRVDFTYDSEHTVTEVKSYFRDVLTLTTTYTYDIDGNVLSWVET